MTMAGETPGAGRHNKDQRRKLGWKDDRSTNKYYASGQDSTVSGRRTAADSSLKPGETPVPRPAPRPLRRADDRSTDKYYADQMPQGPAARQPGVPPGVAARPVQQTLSRASGDDLVVTEPHEVNGAMGEVVERLNSGQSPVVLFVARGNTALLRRTRAALEQLVTREIISEEQYHDVRLSYEAGGEAQADVDKKLGAPAPRGEVKTEENESAPGDDAEFLGGQDEDEARMATPGPTQEVDTSGDPAGEEEDEDNDFLAGPEPSAGPTPEDPERLKDPYLYPKKGFGGPGELAKTDDDLDRAIDTDKPNDETRQQLAKEQAEETSEREYQDEVLASQESAPPPAPTPPPPPPHPKTKPGRRGGRGT
jgi:hypothetical protein